MRKKGNITLNYGLKRAGGASDGDEAPTLQIASATNRNYNGPYSLLCLYTPVSFRRFRHRVDLIDSCGNLARLNHAP
jgi:hypothetical protein